MKISKFYLSVLTVFLSSLMFFSCSDNDTPDPKPNPEPETPDAVHYDIWVRTSSYSGGGSDPARLVQGVKSLDEQKEITFEGVGVDVTAKLFQENIIKGQYYYQVPEEKDRFGKYKISAENGIEIITEFPFKNNKLKDRRYSHTWINDNTLVLMAANGDASKIIWIKVDTDKMKIVSEGELDLPTLPAGGVLSTSGLAGYRKSDNTIIYTYLNNKDKTHFYAAFIDAADMSVKATVEERRAEFMAGTAYGELLQSKTFFDGEGNYYVACNSEIKGAPSYTQQYGTLLRINKGTMEFDKDYIGFQGNNYSRGKLITAEYLTTNKALLYIQDPKHTGAEKWGSDYNCYYAILDLTTDELTELELPYSEGTFSQRSLIIEDKAYIGVNPKNDDQTVYIYNIKTGSLTKGITIKEGFSFERIVRLED